MKKIYLLSLFLFILNFSIGQIQTQWIKLLGGDSLEEYMKFNLTADGGVIISGASNSINGDVSGNHGGKDFWIVKLNSTGNILWNKSYGGSGDEAPYCITNTQDGGYILTGYTLSNDGDVSGNKGGEDCWVLKIDSNGSIQWKRTLGGTDNDNGYYINNTSDGGYIFTGRSYSSDGDVSKNKGELDIWVVRMDASGNIIWEKSYGGTKDDIPTKIIQNSDKSFIVLGFSESVNGDLSSNKGLNDIWIFKLDSNGNVIWGKTYGGSNNDYSEDIVPKPGGGYCITATTYSNDGDITNPRGLKDGWVINIDEQGNIAWQKTIGGTNSDACSGISVVSDGGLLITGNTKSTDGDFDKNFGKADAWIIKMNQTGVMQWKKMLGGSNGDYAYCIYEDGNGNYWVGGETFSNDSGFNGYHARGDFWVSTLSANNGVNISNDENNFEYILFPNPTMAELHFNFLSTPTNGANLIICDLTGQVLYRNLLTNQNNTVTIPLQPNIYIYHLWDNKGTIKSSGRLIKL